MRIHQTFSRSATRRGRGGSVLTVAALAVALAAGAAAGQQEHPPRAYIDGTGPGWVPVTEQDFYVVNGWADTWRWEDGMLKTTGQPIGVMCTVRPYTNLEISVEWRHLQSGGNSGIFLWVRQEALDTVKPGKLQQSGIEIQMLDHGYHELYEQRRGEKGTFFTTHGDVWGTGDSKLTPFPPVSPNGIRSFPSKHLSRGAGEWNHYYVRGINGEVRLWVNGEEVSGGTGADPRSGPFCMEAEGAPVEFRNLRVRELP